jgi:hypothetical protein
MLNVNTKKLKSLYYDLLKETDIDVLELGLKEPNIFQILKSTNNELKHSNFLSWLLNPNESHKIGDIFLKRFIREVFSSEKFEELEQTETNDINFSNVEVRREWKNIDVLIVLEKKENPKNKVIICIENKIKSKEQEKQLTTYKNTVEKEFPKEKKAFVYLTLDGDEPEKETSYMVMSYSFIVETLEKIILILKKSINKTVETYINDYLIILMREHMKTDELSILAQKIYNNHKILFDFIFENMPDDENKLRKQIIKEIENRNWVLGSINKYYIRFLTPSIKSKVYINKEIKNGWKNNETFLFEIDVRDISRGKNKINFKTVIAPSDSNYDVRKLENILCEIPGFEKKPKSTKWLVNKNKTIYFNYDNLIQDNEDLDKKIKSFLDQNQSIIDKVEKQFQKYEEELIKMKAVDDHY